jgi:hypothetical protein
MGEATLFDLSRSPERPARRQVKPKIERRSRRDRSDPSAERAKRSISASWRSPATIQANWWSAPWSSSRTSSAEP